MNWRVFSLALGENSKLTIIQHYVFVSMMAVIIVAITNVPCVSTWAGGQQHVGQHPAGHNGAQPKPLISGDVSIYNTAGVAIVCAEGETRVLDHLSSVRVRSSSSPSMS